MFVSYPIAAQGCALRACRITCQILLWAALSCLTLSSANGQSPGNEDTYMYIDCIETVQSSPTSFWVCLDLRYDIEGTGNSKVQGFSVPLIISGSSGCFVSIDTTVASAFPSGSGVSGFAIKSVYLANQGSNFYHVLYGAVNFAGGVTGDSLFAKICLLVNSNCVIVIDTLTTQEGQDYRLTDEVAAGFVPGWGGPPGFGYPLGGVSCQCVPTHATGTGYGDLPNSHPEDYKNHIDTYFGCLDYQLRDITRRANNNPHGHNGQMQSGASISTYKWSGGQPWDLGILMTDPNNIWNDSIQGPGVDAHVYAGWIYDYLLHELGRNSIDSVGISLISTVDAEPVKINAFFDPDTDRLSYHRAPSGFHSPASCIDVAAHEWGHGVTKYTSKLIHERESGALDESFSDMLGAAVGFATNDADWVLGENIYYPFEGNIRNMEDPNLSQWGAQPDYYKGVWWKSADSIDCPNPHDTNDFCGVHINSGVPNKMFYLLSAGGTHYDVTVTGIGVQNAIKVMFEANRTHWEDTTTFLTAAITSVLSALELDNTTAWAKQAGKAWRAVGVCTAIPGDANANGSYSIADVISIVNYYFNKPGWPSCSANSKLCWLNGLICRGDCTGNGSINLSDVVQLVNYIFTKTCAYPSDPTPGCWMPLPSSICCSYP